MFSRDAQFNSRHFLRLLAYRHSQKMKEAGISLWSGEQFDFFDKIALGWVEILGWSPIADLAQIDSKK